MFASDLDAGLAGPAGPRCPAGRAAQAAAVLAVPGRGAGRLDLGRHHRPARRGRRSRTSAASRASSWTTCAATSGAGIRDDDPGDRRAARRRRATPLKEAFDEFEEPTLPRRRDGQLARAASDEPARVRRATGRATSSQEQIDTAEAVGIDLETSTRRRGGSMGAQMRVYASASGPSRRPRRSPGRMELIAASRVVKARQRVAASAPYARASPAPSRPWRRTPTWTTR